MSQPKVSIVVPVYNVEPYIERCLRTLFEQTLDSLEYIFIDDCGTDGSIDILERVLTDYPTRQPQIKIIRHETNQGVGQSRQDGVDAATGEYIIHCDPDDWVELDMYEKLYNKAKSTDADIVICDYYGVIKDRLEYNCQSPVRLSNESLLKSISGQNKNNSIHGALWNKLIKSHRYKLIKFPKDINYCEDVLALFQILQRRDLRIEYINQPLYYYLDRPESLYKICNHQSLEMDRRLLHTLLGLDYTSSDYQASKYSFCIQVIFNRAFLFGQISDREFTKHYLKYSELIKYNNWLHWVDKVLLRLAMNGYFRVARSLRDRLVKINNIKLVSTKKFCLIRKKK